MNESIAQSTFIEVGHYQISKHTQGAPGDTFLSRKNDTDGRVITVLSDGLGSGIKAGVLSTLTATMAMKFVSSDIPMKRAARIIMNTLPICKERGISYATFTLIDIEPNSSVRIMEYDNPGYVLVRQKTVVEPIKSAIPIEKKKKNRSLTLIEPILYYSEYASRPGDRLVFFSDGVSQAGMGSIAHPMGWGVESVHDFVVQSIIDEPEISAHDLAQQIVLKAQQKDSYQAKDDISCGVVYFRKPRDLLIITGPPINPERDDELFRAFLEFSGKKVICGGTTANIVSRFLGCPLKLEIKNIDPLVPPPSYMEGADLVTEGIITLGKVAEILENKLKYSGAQKGSGLSSAKKENAATRLVDMLLNSDRITFVVGTKINEVHQDPNMPIELEIRRNIVKKLQTLLKEHYLKAVAVRFL